MMMDRRRFIASSTALLPLSTCAGRAMAADAEHSALPVPASNRLSFAVFRNGTRIGTQTLRFTNTGANLRVDNQVGLQVKLLDVVVFNYQAAITEHWAHGAFASAHSTINANGTLHRVQVERRSGAVAISGNRIKSYTAPANALPLTYWNKALLQGPMINMQTGKTDHPTINDLGWFALPTLPSGTVRAQAYKLSGSLHLTIYYDQNNRWQGLAFDHSGHITYEPILS
ncbi:MAG TPA: DUF6134 family protein [Acidiphilium sp.]|nr:DUF6134 family protein [Acidiphilium sp.]HQU24123.1 DUF6134 family protein [Acidiphilium sp.]